MRHEAIAYHITFGTYGMRLHGDKRLTVDLENNMPGAPYVTENSKRKRFERGLMLSLPIWLSRHQQRFIEETVPRICERGGWTCHAVAAGPDHVHVLLTADAEGKAVRRLLKRWLGQALSERWPGKAERGWWAEGGSVKYVWNERQFESAGNYVVRQRATEESEPGTHRSGRDNLECPGGPG